MNLRCMLPALFLSLLLLSGLGINGARAQSDEERYVQEIRSLLIAAELHLSDAADALAQCLANFSRCVMHSSSVVGQLNASRNSLVAVRASVLSLSVPGRYQLVNDLVVRGLTDSIDGIGLHMEGLSEGSLAKFEAGSDLTGAGRQELQDAVDLLRAMPPRSTFEEILLFLAIAISGSLIVSVALLVWWYRRQVRRRSPPPGAKEI